MTRPRTVACPHCGTPVPWTPSARWRPFCSERCKTIDLGAWASERYRIPVPEAPERDAFGEDDAAADSPRPRDD